MLEDEKHEVEWSGIFDCSRLTYLNDGLIYLESGTLVLAEAWVHKRFNSVCWNISDVFLNSAG